MQFAEEREEGRKAIGGGSESSYESDFSFFSSFFFSDNAVTATAS